MSSPVGTATNGGTSPSRYTISDFRALHGLRHVFASMLASSGQVDLYTLQKLLTHKSPTMTQRYAHLRDQVLMKAADLAGNLIEEYTRGPKGQRRRSK